MTAGSSAPTTRAPSRRTRPTSRCCACAIARVATSGATKRRWRTPAGERYHHLIDTRTGRPFDSVLLTVTVVARTATAADVLAKTAYLLGAERGLDAVQRHGADALAVTTEGAVLTTPGMREYLL